MVPERMGQIKPIDVAVSMLHPHLESVRKVLSHEARNRAVHPEGATLKGEVLLLMPSEPFQPTEASSKRPCHRILRAWRKA
jgi:hypothetical protein